MPFRAVFEPSHLPCPACGEPSDLPLEALVEQPQWACKCGFQTVLPVDQLQGMLDRIRKSMTLVRLPPE